MIQSEDVHVGEMGTARFRRALLAALACVATIAFGAQEPREEQGVRAEPEVQGPTAETPRAKKARERPTRVKRIALATPPAEVANDRGPKPKPGTPLQIGFGRPIASLDHDGAAASLDWESVAGGGLVAALSIHSPSAAAMRIGLRVGAIPPHAVLRFYPPGEETLFEATGQELLDTVARNLEAGEHGPDARMWWSPIVEAAEIVMEIELPAGAQPHDVRIAVPQVSHLVTTARDDFVMTKSASYCQVDVSCSIGTWGQESNAVARMVFTSGGASYLCTGTLLADNDPTTAIPYFLTANHCISGQTVASTLQTFWFYRSSGCNSAGVANYQIRTGGATLLYATANTDSSFLRLNSTPPTGAVYAGWTTASVPTIGTDVTAIHHPAGDLQKISLGDIAGYATCTSATGGTFTCYDSSSASSTFYILTWRSGVTEGGSSGSGLFRDNGHYLIGQLYGGSSTCLDPTSGDFYGRFDVVYNAALKNWLAPPPTLTVTRAGTGSGTVTSSPGGINCGTTCSAPFTAGSAVVLTATHDSTSTFAGWSGGPCSGTGTCAVPMNAAASVVATFNRITFPLSVAKVGPGSITSWPIGLNCGTTCSASFASGTQVTLSAGSPAGWTFSGWTGGGCSGRFPCPVTMSSATSVTGTFVRTLATGADFNQSGGPDLLWRQASTGATYIWFMNALARTSDRLLGTIDPSWTVEGTGDFNNDGHTDVIWRNTTSGAAYVWYLVGGVFQSDALLFTIDPQWRIEAVSDFNLDGKPDLLMRNAATGLAFVWFYNGAAATGDQFLFSIDPAWRVQGVGDFNLDGKPDLLFRNSATGLAFAWYTDWNGSSVSLAGSSAPLFSIDPTWEVAQVADWNGDGQVDLVFRNTATGVVFVWYLNGTTLNGSANITQVDPSWEIVPRH